MKRFVCFIAIAALLLIPSCGKEPDFVDSVTVLIPSKTEPSELHEPEEEVNVEVTYGILDNPQSNSLVDIYVKFPILSGTVNDELVNEILKNEIFAIISADTSALSADGEKLTYEITDVTPAYLGKNFVSFLFAGNYYVTGSAHPTEFVRSLNIDIEKGECIELEAFCKDIGELSELFESGNAFTVIPTGNETADSELSAMDRDGLGYFTTAYFTDDNGEVCLAVSIEIPHALGDHAEYKAKLSDVEHLLTDGIITLTKGTK